MSPEGGTSKQRQSNKQQRSKQQSSKQQAAKQSSVVLWASRFWPNPDEGTSPGHLDYAPVRLAG